MQCETPDGRAAKKRKVLSPLGESETLREPDRDTSLLLSPMSTRDRGLGVDEPVSSGQGEGEVPSACSWAEEMETETRVGIRDKTVQTGWRLRMLESELLERVAIRPRSVEETFACVASSGIQDPKKKSRDDGDPPHLALQVQARSRPPSYCCEFGGSVVSDSTLDACHECSESYEYYAATLYYIENRDHM